MSIDINAPIVPFEGMGGIKLYAKLEDLNDILSQEGVIMKKMHPWIRFQIRDAMYFFFHKKNGKLFKMTTLDGYKGKLWDKIGTDTVEKTLLSLDDSFVWDDWEEVWQSLKGVIIEGYDALLSHNFSEQRKLRIHNRFSHLRYEVIVENFV